LLSLRRAKSDIVKVGQLVWLKGYVASNDGNLSIRLTEDKVLITPSGLSKGFLSQAELVLTDMKGGVISGVNRPTSELKMHLAIYRERPDVRAVVHAHPPVATGFAAAGVSLDQPVLPEVAIDLKKIPLAAYATPGTEELSRSVAGLITDCNAVLMANHGVVTVGPDIFTAYYRMEMVEHFARINFVARLLGGPRLLQEEEVRRLLSETEGRERG